MEHLTAYQKVQLARHPQRPYFLDYVEHLCPDFIEIHGDRKFGDDAAIVAGFGSLRNLPVCMRRCSFGASIRMPVAASNQS